MKQKRRDISKEGDGYITLLPEEPEDMWHAYNLIQEHDNVKSTTLRRVMSETTTGKSIQKQNINQLFILYKGTSSSERVRLNLMIEVEQIEFDSQAGVLRLKGKNLTESAHIKVEFT